MAGVVSGVLAVMPVVASAGGLEDPEPASWPTVEQPADNRGGATDPEPVTQPTVDPPDEGGAHDPEPAPYPTPAPQ